MKTAEMVKKFTSLTIYVVYLWFISIQMAAMLDLIKWQPHRSPVLGPGKFVNHMVLSTSGPNLVLLEESEPSSTFIALIIDKNKKM